MAVEISQTPGEVLHSAPGTTASPHWKCLPGKHQIALSGGFSLYKGGNTRANPLSLPKHYTNGDPSYLLNRESRSCFDLELGYILQNRQVGQFGGHESGIEVRNPSCRSGSRHWGHLNNSVPISPPTVEEAEVGESKNSYQTLSYCSSGPQPNPLSQHWSSYSSIPVHDSSLHSPSSELQKKKKERKKEKRKAISDAICLCLWFSPLSRGFSCHLPVFLPSWPACVWKRLSVALLGGDRLPLGSESLETWRVPRLSVLHHSSRLFSPTIWLHAPQILSESSVLSSASPVFTLGLFIVIVLRGWAFLRCSGLTFFDNHEEASISSSF